MSSDIVHQKNKFICIFVLRGMGKLLLIILLFFGGIFVVGLVIVGRFLSSIKKAFRFTPNIKSNTSTKSFAGDDVLMQNEKYTILKGEAGKHNNHSDK